MSNTIVHATPGVTYTWQFNQNVQTGTFWDGSPYVISQPGLKLMGVQLETEDGVGTPNTIISGITMSIDGFTGELYVNGLVKNPQSAAYYDQNGNFIQNGTHFDSRLFNVYGQVTSNINGAKAWGWSPSRRVRDPQTNRWINVLLPTNEAASYNNHFNLNAFLATRELLTSGQGITLQAGDAIAQAVSNVGNANDWQANPNNQYPYQKFLSRSVVLSYGTLFVLEEHPSELSFRPPLIWPEENRVNRPLIPVSRIDNRLPSGSDLVPKLPSSAKFKPSNYLNDTKHMRFCYGYAFGGATNYAQSMPLYAAMSPQDILSGTNIVSAYGAYYQADLYTRLSAAFSDDVPLEGRRNCIRTIVQFGLDAYGTIRTLGETSSGAGQKPGCARPYAIIAGWFLNDNAMRGPESTMLADVNRSTGYFNSRKSELNRNVKLTKWVVPQLFNRTVNMINYAKFLHGDVDTSVAAKKRWLGVRSNTDSLCYLKVVNDPNNLLLHYEYLGASHRRAFSGTGATFWQTDATTKYADNPNSANINKGNFAVIQFPKVPTEFENWGFSHDGKTVTFAQSRIKVTSGPGAGDTLYRIIRFYGTPRTKTISTDPVFRGMSMVLDRPWQNGVPDSTSTFEMIPFTEEDVGHIFYLINPFNAQNSMGDSNLSLQTAYSPIVYSPIARLYGFMRYIEMTTGTNPDLDKEATLAHEYIDQRVFFTQYGGRDNNGFNNNNSAGIRNWETFVARKWYNLPNNMTEISRIYDWSIIPGILEWSKIPVDSGAPPVVPPPPPVVPPADPTDPPPEPPVPAPNKENALEWLIGILENTELWESNPEVSLCCDLIGQRYSDYENLIGELVNQIPVPDDDQPEE